MLPSLAPCLTSRPGGIPRGCCAHSGIVSEPRNPEVRKLQPQKGLRAGLPDLGPGERHCFYYPGKETNLPSALEGRPISLFPKRLLNQTP